LFPFVYLHINKNKYIFVISKIYIFVIFLYKKVNIFSILVFINKSNDKFMKGLTPMATGIQVFDALKSWQKAHENNAAEALNLLNNKDELKISESTIFDNYDKNQEKIGLEFDFMEGQDPSNEKNYTEQLLKLGQGEIASKDTNKDGEVSLAEYIANELQDLGESDDEDMALDAVTTSYLMFQIMDQGMGNSDSSGKLSAEEFASFYKNMDSFKLNENLEGELTQEYDGKLDMDSAGEFIPFLVQNIFDEETYNAVKEMAPKILEVLN